MEDTPDLDALLQQALQMQQQLATAQAEARAAVVQGRAGGGAVTVTMTGEGEVTRISIAPEVVDPTDVELLEDLVLAALRDAGEQVRAIQSRAVSELGDLGLGGGLGGLLGGR